MPHFKLTGYHSHRHPFLGYEEDQQKHTQVALGAEGDIIDLDNPLAPGIYEGMAGDEGVSAAKIARPFVAGLTSGLIVYGLSRTFKVDSKKARKVAFVFGGINVLVGLASDYIYREMKALQTATVTPEGT